LPPAAAIAHCLPSGIWHRNFAGMRLAELGSTAGDVAYSAVSMATIRFEKRLKVDRDLQGRIKAVRVILKL
jgi:hypothetical protein